MQPIRSLQIRSWTPDEEIRGNTNDFRPDEKRKWPRELRQTFPDRGSYYSSLAESPNFV